MLGCALTVGERCREHMSSTSTDSQDESLEVSSIPTTNTSNIETESSIEQPGEVLASCTDVVSLDRC